MNYAFDGTDILTVTGRECFFGTSKHKTIVPYLVYGLNIRSRNHADNNNPLGPVRCSKAGIDRRIIYATLNSSCISHSFYSSITVILRTHK